MEVSEHDDVMQMINSNIDSMQDMFLTFTLYQQNYGLKIHYVAEIIRMQQITTVPDVVPAIKGVINLRGQVIPIIDICTRFNLIFHEYDDRTCIIILSFNNSVIGCIVDRISEVTHIPHSKIQPACSFEQREVKELITGLGKVDGKVIFLLDVDNLVYGTFNQKIT